MHEWADPHRRQRLPLGEQLSQGGLHGRLALLRRQVQDTQVFPVGLSRVLAHQGVISHAEHARGKQLLPVAILGKGPGLAHQPVDHVAVVHALLVATPQAWQPLDQLPGVPNLHLFGIEPDLDPRADQPARYRITVPFDMNQAAAIHPTAAALAGFQPSRRQRPQHGSFLGQALAPTGIELLLHLAQKLAIRFAADKVAAATQQQGLVHRLFETPVPLLDVAVLVGVIGLDLLADHPVVIQQGLIALRELAAFAQIVHRRAQAIGPVTRRHRPQLRQGVLQPVTEALETLREADRRRLPVRVRQHEVIEQVLEALSLDRHLQVAHVREVRGRQPARLMHLRKEDFLRRPGQGTPTLHLALQRAQLPVGKPTGVAPLQLAEEGLGLESRLALQQRTHFGPNLCERIDARPPVMRPGQRTGQLLLPAILACGLLVHVRPHCRRSQRLPGRQQPPHLPHLLVRDHRKPPCMKHLRIAYGLAAACPTRVTKREN